MTVRYPGDVSHYVWEVVKAPPVDTAIPTPRPVMIGDVYRFVGYDFSTLSETPGHFAWIFEVISAKFRGRGTRCHICNCVVAASMRSRPPLTQER